jgi:hypothetical protein
LAGTSIAFCSKIEKQPINKTGGLKSEILAVESKCPYNVILPLLGEPIVYIFQPVEQQFSSDAACPRANCDCRQLSAFVRDNKKSLYIMDEAHLR